MITFLCHERKETAHVNQSRKKGKYVLFRDHLPSARKELNCPHQSRKNERKITAASSLRSQSPPAAAPTRHLPPSPLAAAPSRRLPSHLCVAPTLRLASAVGGAASLHRLVGHRGRRLFLHHLAWLLRTAHPPTASRLDAASYTA